MKRVLMLALLLLIPGETDASDWAKPVGDVCLKEVGYDPEGNMAAFKACAERVLVDLGKCPVGGYGLIDFLVDNEKLNIELHGTRARALLANKINRNASASVCGR